MMYALLDMTIYGDVDANARLLSFSCTSVPVNLHKSEYYVNMSVFHSLVNSATFIRF